MQRLLESGLKWFGVLVYHLGLAGFVRWLNRASPKVLLYHACEPVEGPFIRGVRSNTPPDEFALHMRHIRRYYRPVALSELLAPDRPAKAVLVSFDDGYRSVYEHALPVLRELSIPSAMYLISDAVDNATLSWVNEVVWAANTYREIAAPIIATSSGVDAAADVGIHVAALTNTYNRSTIESLVVSLRKACSYSPDAIARQERLYVSRAEIKEMQDGGMVMGNHTVLHPNLTQLSSREQRDEIEGAHRSLLNRGLECDSLAYPFGAVGEAARDSAKRLGYASLMEVGGYNAPLRHDAIARVPVTATTDAELFAELEIITPIRGRARNAVRRARR